ncbi:hypothetical protein K4F52_006978 [Lecanicillium sp. MT-2017a]|nr:hypothetical protein K4F52_006978 [Lecanicillium sp. MT-2017a]
MAAPTASASSSPGWLAQLEADGFFVLKDLVSPQNCAQFREQGLAWLEKFPHGFNRSDQSTWTRHHLPYGITSAPLLPSQHTMRLEFWTVE